MRKIIQYMMMALIAVVLASCANDISEESTPTVKSNIRFVVDDFPMFEKPSTRTIGEEDKGKTAWAVGDEICVKLESKELGIQTATLKYNGVKFEIQDGNSLCYLEGEPVTACAYYAPGRKYLNDGYLGYKDDGEDGIAEFIEATCNVHYGDDNYIDISFANVTRNYSRLRIATMPNKPITVDFRKFTPSGGWDFQLPSGRYTLTSDEKGNAYLYGTFDRYAEVTVKYREATLATHTFSKKTENAKSYALDATVVSLADEAITYEQIADAVKKELEAGKTYINLILAPDADENTFDAIHYGLEEARDRINLTLIGCKKIPYGGFMRWTMLKSIALPDVTEIEGKAFSDCTKLQKVVLGNLTKVYGNVGKNGIFDGCRTKDIDLVLSKDQKVMNGGETEGGYCWTADITKDYSGSDEHNGRVFLDYDFQSITCDYRVP